MEFREGEIGADFLARAIVVRTTQIDIYEQGWIGRDILHRLGLLRARGHGRSTSGACPANNRFMTWSLEAENFAPNARVLKQRLFDEYGGFADKRIKNLDKSSLFIVDDRATGPSFDARGHLFDWFCTIFARVRGPRTLDVELGRSVPTSKAVDAWMQAGNAKWETGPIRLVVPIELGQEGRLVDLAALVEQIVRPGATYSVPSYKYTCPRTGASLRRLATALKAAGER